MDLLHRVKSLLGAAPAAAVDLAAVPTDQLQASLAAGLELQSAVESLAGEGRTPVDVVMNGNAFTKWQMYPWQGGILDQRSNSQYFYHSHEGYQGEHGHFHTFIYHQRKLVHLVALGMDERGRINQLYTFNRWAPGDHYFPADTLKTFLPRFHIGPSNDLDARLHRFVTQALVLFRAEIEHLLDERDATFARYRETHGGASPFEDRALEITSALPADVPTQMACIAAELQRRGAVGEVGGAGVPAGAPRMTTAEAVVDEALAERSTTQLQHSLAAGLALREIEARLLAQGRTVVEAVMNGKPYEHWRMYPWDTGVTDKTTGSQYFYHAHPDSPEHGHFHLFCHHHGQLVHLVAVAMDDRGEPVGLSTVNRWVTGDLYLPPHEVLAFLPRFRIEVDAFDRMVSDYLRQLLLLFQPEIGALVRERERVFVDYRAAHAGREPFEDRDLEVTSTLPIDVEGHIARLEAELRRRSEG